MNLKAICTSILFFCSILLVSGQSKEILARSAMLNAEESYNNGNYSECQNHLKDVEANLGKTNSAIQYLKVKSLVSLGSKDQYNKEIWSQADSELKRFFDVTPENSYVPEKYEEMLVAVSKVRKYFAAAEEKFQLAENQKRLDLTTFEDAKRRNTTESFKMYINKFPQGLYIDDAKAKLKVLYDKEISVTIGSQVWMSKNLDVDYYRNGDKIPQVQNPQEWARLTSGAWCYWNNNPLYGYGKLYNLYAVTDPRELAPEGWHIPSEFEFLKMIGQFGSNNKIAVTKLKATSGWPANENGTNESGFSLLLGRTRDSMGEFSQYIFTYFWTNYNNQKKVSTVVEFSKKAKLFDYTIPGNKRALGGLYVRCVKNQ